MMRRQTCAMTRYISDSDLFGGCPVCGVLTGIMNVGAVHWGYCGRHRHRWWVGTDLFADWRRQDAQEWARNAFHLQDFTRVEPRRSATRVCACCGAPALGRTTVPHSPRCTRRLAPARARSGRRASSGLGKAGHGHFRPGHAKARPVLARALVGPSIS